MDPIFYWLFLGPFPQFSVPDGLRLSYLKDSFKAGVDECPDLLQCHSCGAPYFSSIQQERFCAEDPVFDGHGQVSWGTNVHLMKEGCSCSSNSHFYIGKSLLLSQQCYLVGETYSSKSPFSNIGVVLTAVLFLKTLLVPLWTFRPGQAELSATILVFSCIYCWLWERRARSSAKSRSSWVQGVHWIPFPLWAVDVFNTQSMASRNRKGHSRHPCLNSVFTWKASVSWWPQTTLHAIPL